MIDGALTISQKIQKISLRGLAKKKVIVVLPAYNAEKTLEATISDLPEDGIDEIILVDDASQDNTVDIARKMGIHVIEHKRNLGYGGNQKTCYAYALEHGADIVVMLHPDYQYDSRVVPHAIGFIQLGICDVVLGNRIRSRKEALEAGMPRYKYLSNRLLTILENFILGQNLGEFHSGFRAYSREVLEKIPFEKNSNSFLFDTQFLVQAVHMGFSVADVPIPVRYFAEASSISFSNSLRYGLGTLGVLILYCLGRLGIYRSTLFKEKTSPV